MCISLEAALDQTLSLACKKKEEKLKKMRGKATQMAFIGWRISQRLLGNQKSAIFFCHQIQPAAAFHGLHAASGVKRAKAAAKSSDFGNHILGEDIAEVRTYEIPVAASSQQQIRTPKLVIFDKYGTLIDFHQTWTPWLTNLTRRYVSLTLLIMFQFKC